MGLPRDRRLRRPGEFRRVFNEGKRAGDRLFLLTVASGETGKTRFGLSAGKRVGGSVVRNRLKRRVREILRGLDIDGEWDVVITARPAAASASFRHIQESLSRLAGGLGLVR